MANLCKHEKGALPTNGDGSNLSVDIQHAIAVNVHQVVPSALFIITEEVQRLDILSEGTPEHMIHSNPQNDTCMLALFQILYSIQFQFCVLQQRSA